MMDRVLALAGVVIALAGFSPAAAAAAGELDRTFGGTGRVTTELIQYGSSYANGVVVQPDGKIVAAGQSFYGGMALTRYHPNGSLDASFDSDGIVTSAIGVDPHSAAASAVALQADGRIVAAGSGYNGTRSLFALTRFNSNGSPDTSFGSAGIVMTPVGDSSAAVAVAIQPDGKVVAAGNTTFYGGGMEAIAIARYGPTGSLDPSFGAGGIVYTWLPPTVYLRAMVLQEDGKIVVAGAGYDEVGQSLTLARYNLDGSLDSGFGVGGIVTTSNTGANAIAVQPDGRIVVAGAARWNTQGVFALARYNANGSLDTSFGTGGIAYIPPIGVQGSGATAIAIQSNGKIVAVGEAHDGNVTMFAVTRYNPNGGLDPGFGSGGIVTTQFGGCCDIANAVALQADGRIIAAGGRNVFALARYDVDSIPGPSPGPIPDPIPTLSPWGLPALVAMLAGLALLTLRRQRR